MSSNYWFFSFGLVTIFCLVGSTVLCGFAFVISVNGPIDQRTVLVVSSIFGYMMAAYCLNRLYSTHKPAKRKVAAKTTMPNKR